MSDVRRSDAIGRPGPAPVGSLGRALVRALSTAQTRVLAATLVLALLAVVGLTSLVGPTAEAVGPTLAVWLLGFLAFACLVAAVAALAILPTLLLPARDRAAFAAHAWIGAREARGVVGRAARATSLPADATSAIAWLTLNPPSERNGGTRVEAWLLAGRVAEARTEADALPQRTPLETYRRAEAVALVASQIGEPVDEKALDAALAAIPVGIERTEAAVSRAVLQARRALPNGDWRAPLLEVRRDIPGSDVRILLADFGLPMFEILLRRAVLPIGLVLLAIALAFTALSAVR